MNAIVLLLIGIAILIIGYITYGSWLAKQWGVDAKRETPAHSMQDGVDYVPAKAPVLFGHHFSSIAGAGPINGPIQAAVFGWVPVLLWILVGGIFFGAVHDFGALYASIRHKGQSIGVVIEENIGERAKKLFLIFAYLTLILVVAAFASIVAGTFKAAGVEDIANARTATISIYFMVLAILFGFFVYRKNAPLGIASVVGCVGICLVIALGYNYPIFYLSNTTWMVILGIYILIASVTPVWILLQPRDYLSSFLLYAMMIAAIIGVFGSHPTISMPSFVGFEVGGNFLFPTLFITIACGAISGFHSLVGSGTTSKQLDSEKDAKAIGYGGMLVECALAIIALIAVGYIWEDFTAAENAITTPTVVFATGISRMLAAMGLTRIEGIAYSLVILAVSTFALTSLDTATRLARFMFQELFTRPGYTPETETGYRKVLSNKYVATVIAVAIGVALGLGGYSKIWGLFGAANQLLAALALLAIASWLGNMGKNNKMLYFPMLFMLIATLSSLVLTFIAKIKLVISGAGDMAAWLQMIFSAVLFVLAIVLVIEGIQSLTKSKANKKQNA